MLRSELEIVTSFVENYPDLDSDGATRLIQVALADRNVQFRLMQGYVEQVSTSEILQPHFWIVVGKFYIDYRLQKWMGNKAPHGVFLPREHEDFEYAGAEHPASLETSRLLYQVVTNQPAMPMFIVQGAGK